jgi:hypothetical protein
MNAMQPCSFKLFECAAHVALAYHGILIHRQYQWIVVRGERRPDPCVQCRRDAPVLIEANDFHSGDWRVFRIQQTCTVFDDDDTIALVQ